MEFGIKELLFNWTKISCFLCTVWIDFSFCVNTQGLDSHPHVEKRKPSTCLLHPGQCFPMQRTELTQKGRLATAWAGPDLATCRKAVKEQMQLSQEKHNLPSMAYESSGRGAGPPGGSSGASSRKLTSPRRGGSWWRSTAAGEGLIGDSGV